MWYKVYNAKTNYSRIKKQTHTFENFIKLYLKYGLFYQNNFFVHNFWYRTKLKTHPQNQHLYFRKYYFLHKILAIEHSYFIRLTTPEYFTLKLYIFKYANWLLLSMQWFKPLKNAKTSSINRIKSLDSSFPIIYSRNKYPHSPNKRKLMLLFLISQLKTQSGRNNIQYNF
jgi:hypothetical protein